MTSWSGPALADGGLFVPDDWPWLAAWIFGPRGRGSYVSARAAPGWLEGIRAALPRRFAPPAAGGNVDASQGEA